MAAFPTPKAAVRHAFDAVGCGNQVVCVTMIITNRDDTQVNAPLEQVLLALAAPQVPNEFKLKTRMD